MNNNYSTYSKSVDTINRLIKEEISLISHSTRNLEKLNAVSTSVGHALENIRMLAEKYNEAKDCITKIESYYSTSIGFTKKFDELKGESSPIQKATYFMKLCESKIESIKNSPEFIFFNERKKLTSEQKEALITEIFNNYLGKKNKYIESNPTIQKLTEKAQSFAKLVSEKPNAQNRTFTVKGLPNITGNNCYMNSSLQCLEASYGVFNLQCQSLLNRNLSLFPDETLIEFENRLLKNWCPIPNNGNPQERAEKILFKWTYLLLLQAKLKGQTNGTTIETALTLHHGTCFTLKKHFEFSEKPTEQKDAAAYQEYWHDMLGIQFDMSSQRKADIKGKEIFRDPINQKTSLLQVSIAPGKNLLSLIREGLNETMTPEKGGDNNQVEFDNVLTSTYSTTTKFNCLPPPILTVQFKRFLMNEYNESYKVDSKLPMTAEECSHLNLSEFFSEDHLKGKNAIYELKAFSIHHGVGIHNGHYTSYVQNNGQWYCCDDAKTYPVKDVPFKDAYMMSFVLKL